MIILLKKLIKKLKYYFSIEGIYLRKIQKIARFNEFKTDILGFPFVAVDSSSFLGQYNEIIKRNIYKFESSNLKPIIIDCGVNIGLSIIIFKKMFPNAIIFGFEPDPIIHRVASDNIVNAKLENVTIYNEAVWIEDTTLSFYQEGSAGGRLFSGEGHKTIQVKTFDLKNIINQDIDFLKIDIEGAEYDIISDLGNNLSFVRNIFIEYHSKIAQPQKLNEILSILSRNNFRYFLESGYSISNHPFISRMEIDGFDNLINIFGYRTK